MEIKKIMNPVDGSEHSRRATIYACELARLVNAEIVLLHCHRKFPVILAEPYFQDAVNQIIRDSENLITPFVKIIQDHGVGFETRILEGSAGRMIPEAARIEKADIIVMGSRGCTNLEGLFLGSVAHKVLQRGSCPVLVVR
ncbi:Usp2 [Desulforapulum autotrophicum HRM2]|uniref:Usp2 n=1 Tax=Desulforapulum autotrophicum (strain ATCC 43914 / DSM 3382 / VKM B-1955 / HRM2) TaxID=177437 RepID=C0Q9C4_DESAH|nr:universal stress protein [Desulforapulum autotrophicum]ACN16629.1 Usp2 [Desulforapulum autotrophicum HRM2]